MYPFNRIRERIYVRPSESAVPRLIVIDGCNIARSSCGINRDNVNCAGLMAIIRFLLIRDLDVVVFLPVIYNNNYNFNATNAQVLPKLQGLDVLTFTPARTARADRPAFINYDDLYVLEFAERHGGSVLSGDRFEDIANEQSYRGFRRIIEERRIDVIFRPLGTDFVHYGRDRFFRFLPELCIIHDKSNSWLAEERIQRRLYCFPSDEDYSKVLSRREQWTAERRDEIICAIDALFDEIAAKNCLIPKIIPVQTLNAKERRRIKDSASGDCEESTKPRSRYHHPCNNRNALMDPEELTKRWLSPPAFCEPTIAGDSVTCSTVICAEQTNLKNSTMTPTERMRKQRKSQTVPQNTSITITTTTTTTSSSALAITQSPIIPYDPKCINILNRLDQIFDRQLIVKVLKENKSRDLYVIASLCAQRTLET